jgi:hypothetical protein
MWTMHDIVVLCDVRRSPEMCAHVLAQFKS